MGQGHAIGPWMMSNHSIKFPKALISSNLSNLVNRQTDGQTQMKTEPQLLDGDIKNRQLSDLVKYCPETNRRCNNSEDKSLRRSMLPVTYTSVTQEKTMQQIKTVLGHPGCCDAA